MPGKTNIVFPHKWGDRRENVILLYKPVKNSFKFLHSNHFIAAYSDPKYMSMIRCTILSPLKFEELETK